MAYADRIKPTDDSIGTYLDSLKKQQYQIPTFQREIVWEKYNVKNLWDSIYKFYPIGSILIWRTGVKLHKHRAIGGHIISRDFELPEYRYILDGQQRTTSLLTSLYGGEIKGRKDFDPSLYIDLTISGSSSEDKEIYRKRFLFWDEIDDRGGVVRQNVPRKLKYQQGLIVKLLDIKEIYSDIERNLHDNGYTDFDHPYRESIRIIKNVLDNYRISFIELRGIEVSEVCEIFERINQEGRPLDIFDIVVAKTFRPENEEEGGFYLRELLDDFKKETGGNFSEIGEQTYLQILAIIIRQNVQDSGVHNITERYLNEIHTKHIEDVWPKAIIAFRQTFDFFENHLHLKGPKLIPYRYFYMSIAAYFYNHPAPNYELLKKYFWYYSFHTEDLLRNTTHLRFQHVDWLHREKQGEEISFDRLLIDRLDLRKSVYSSRGRFSRAILSLLSNQEPKDWKHFDRSVMGEIYYRLTDHPELHHIFPVNYISNHQGKNKLSEQSLMNIAFIPKKINREIRDKNPLKYLQEYDGKDFDKVLRTHLIPADILEWSRSSHMPDNALDIFIEKRIHLFIEELKRKMSGVRVDVIDTMEEERIEEMEDLKPL